MKKNSFLFRGKGHFVKRGKQIKQNLKFIGKSRRTAKLAKQAREKKNSTTISLAQAPSRLFSFWPFDEDPYFSTFCEMWWKFHFAVSCKTQCKQNMQIEIETKACGKPKHSGGSLFDWHLSYLSTGSNESFFYSYLVFLLRFCFFFPGKLNKLTSLTREQKDENLKFWPDFVDSNLNQLKL